MLSPHQAPYIRALADGPHHSVTVIAEDDLSADRQALGWVAGSYGQATVIVHPSKHLLKQYLDAAQQERVHIFGGFHRRGLLGMAQRHVTSTGQRCGIVSEAADGVGIAHWARLPKYVCQRMLLGSQIDFILAIGSCGVRWFRTCGHPVDKVFPFLYVVDLPSGSSALDPRYDRFLRPTAAVDILFVGRCQPTKGLTTLLEALSDCRGADWSCTLLGANATSYAWSSTARFLGIGDKIEFHEAVPNQIVREKIAKADLLVLPSVGKEGWGAVVNEALLQGVPVIASHVCGAADLLSEPWRGSVVRAGSRTELSDALRSWIRIGKKTPETTQRIQSWASCISPDSVAEYVSRILCHVYGGTQRPTAPWPTTEPIRSVQRN